LTIQIITISFQVFGPNASQLDVYSNVVEGQLQDVLSGYNCTVLAYVPQIVKIVFCFNVIAHTMPCF